MGEMADAQIEDGIAWYAGTDPMSLPFDNDTNEKLNKFMEVFNMAAYHAYVRIDQILTKEGYQSREGHPQTKYALKCTNKDGNTVWFNLFAAPEKENTILRDVEAGSGVKITYIKSGNEGQFRNIVGIEYAQVSVPKKQDPQEKEDSIIMQAMVKASAAAMAFSVKDSDEVANTIWDVAEDLFSKVTGRRYGSTAIEKESPKKATAEMTQEEAESYEDSEEEVPF